MSQFSSHKLGGKALCTPELSLSTWRPQCLKETSADTSNVSVAHSQGECNLMTPEHGPSASPEVRTMKNRQALSVFTGRAYHSAATGCHLRRLAIAGEHNAGVRIVVYLSITLHYSCSCLSGIHYSLICAVIACPQFWGLNSSKTKKK